MKFHEIIVPKMMRNYDKYKYGIYDLILEFLMTDKFKWTDDGELDFIESSCRIDFYSFTPKLTLYGAKQRIYSSDHCNSFCSQYFTEVMSYGNLSEYAIKSDNKDLPFRNIPKNLSPMWNYYISHLISGFRSKFIDKSERMFNMYKAIGFFHEPNEQLINRIEKNIIYTNDVLNIVYDRLPDKGPNFCMHSKIYNEHSKFYDWILYDKKERPKTYRNNTYENYREDELAEFDKLDNDIEKLVKVNI